MKSEFSLHIITHRESSPSSIAEGQNFLHQLAVFNLPKGLEQRPEPWLMPLQK
jgi:hypothetical protein